MSSSSLLQANPSEALSDLDWSAADISTTLADRETLSGRELSVLIIEEGVTQKRRFTIRAEGEEPAWLMPTLHAMGEILSLPPNWDSYGANPVNAFSLVSALDLLVATMRPETPTPTVVPTSRGGLQLEWHTRGIDLEVEIESAARSYVRYDDRMREVTWEAVITSNLRPLADVIDELSRRK